MSIGTQVMATLRSYHSRIDLCIYIKEGILWHNQPPTHKGTQLKRFSADVFIPSTSRVLRILTLFCGSGILMRFLLLGINVFYYYTSRPAAVEEGRQGRRRPGQNNNNESNTYRQGELFYEATSHAIETME